MDTKGVVARLSELDVFPGASRSDLNAIAAAGTVVSVPQDWSLMVEKTPADKAYVLLDGSVAVRSGTTEIARLGEGEFVGEMALVNQRLRSATVVAASPLQVLHFTREAVAALRRDVPAFRDALDRTVVTRTL